MPRSSRKAQPKTIGFFGLGETSPKNLKALLERAISEDDVKNATFVIPATRDHFTESIEVVADWMDEQEIAYEVVTDGEDAPRTLRQLVKNAEKTHKAAEVGLGVVSALKEADGDVRFFVLYDEDLDEEKDGGTEEAVGAALDADIPCFDLCKGLDPMEWDDDDDDGGSKSKADEEDEEKVPSRRSTRAAKVEDDDEGEEVIDNSVRAGLPTFEEAKKLGIRALRNLARERKMAPDRKIGSMGPPEVLQLLYPQGADTVIPGAAAPAAAAEEDEPAAPRRGRKAAAPADIDEQVSAAARKATSNGHSGAGDAVIELIAQAVAARVKELIDA